jgi:hypothetical protein
MPRLGRKLKLVTAAPGNRGRQHMAQAPVRGGAAIWPLSVDYFRVGAPLTIITLAIGTLWLWL